MKIIKKGLEFVKGEKPNGPDGNRTQDPAFTNPMPCQLSQHIHLFENRSEWFTSTRHLPIASSPRQTSSLSF